MKFGTSYLHEVYDQPWRFQKLINQLANRVLEIKKKKKTKFDAIAFRGMSGAAVAFPLSAQLKIPLICVRKDRSHGRPIEGSSLKDIKRYLIIDDFIETGETIRTIIRKIDTEVSWARSRAKAIAEEPGIKLRSPGEVQCECVGILLYQEECSWHKDAFRYKKKDYPIFGLK